MADSIVPTKPRIVRRAHIASFEHYQRLYQESLQDTSGFWRRQAQRVHWFHPFERAFEQDFARAEVG